ncbi:MAG: hypothetical protein ACM3KM_02525 [Acidobacteriaceae bacterium]
MLFRKKLRSRLLMLLVLALAFVVWHGVMSSTKDEFKCQYKLFYAVCTPKKQNAKLPTVIQILRAGIKF